MFCPECKAEYRPGFTQCSDCDVDLVHTLPPEFPGTTDASRGESTGQQRELRLIWKGYDEAECVGLCRELMKADIPYNVTQTPAGRSLNMRVKWLYEIGVSDADCDRAKELLGIEGEFADSRYDEEDAEVAFADSAELIPPDDSPPNAEIRNDSYLKPWYPEDATVQVWSQDGEDISDGIAMALTENLIRCRLDRQDGVGKAFVLPEDELRAREIVREITEGEPSR
jgi:hypothetical protein